MAEIKIKKKTPIWPWILLGAGILALLYFLFFNTNDDNVNTDDVSDNDMEIVTDDANSANKDAKILSEMAISKIADYQAYVSKDAEMGLEHEYSHNALDKLIDATEAVANSMDIDVNADLKTARSKAASITNDPADLDHANKIKNAGTIIVQALERIQTEKFPDLDTSFKDLQNSVMEIVPETQTLEQKDAVKDFFEKAGELLTNMKNK